MHGVPVSTKNMASGSANSLSVAARYSGRIGDAVDPPVT
jgi:hypothetical protein